MEITETPQVQEDKREHLNLVFIGHVDAGKSTISGRIMYVFFFYLMSILFYVSILLFV